MDRRALGTAAPMRTFAALAVLAAAGHGGRYAAVFTARPGAPVALRTSAADAAGGTVAETITSGCRTGR